MGPDDHTILVYKNGYRDYIVIKHRKVYKGGSLYTFRGGLFESGWWHIYFRINIF